MEKSHTARKSCSACVLTAARLALRLSHTSLASSAVSLSSVPSKMYSASRNGVHTGKERGWVRKREAHGLEENCSFLPDAAPAEEGAEDVEELVDVLVDVDVDVLVDVEVDEAVLVSDVVSVFLSQT